MHAVTENTGEGKCYQLTYLIILCTLSYPQSQKWIVMEKWTCNLEVIIALEVTTKDDTAKRKSYTFTDDTAKRKSYTFTDK